MTEASSIFVRLSGQDVGLSTLLTQVDQKTQRAADNALRLQAQYARLSQTQGNTSQATNILSNALQNNGGASERVVVSLSQQLATVQRGPSAYAQFGSAAKSSLVGILGPAALASAAVGGLIAVGQSFADAFAFKATLDANAASLSSALTGFRDVGKTTAEAEAFGRRYNITQAQTNSILTSSIDVLKQSSGSVTQLETALLRLGTRDVSKPISEAARAVRELQAGDVTSIKELFNVPAKDALAMKNQVAGGADAIQVLTAWLDRAGVGMAALEQRTQGAAGKMNELAVAQEDMVLAQAKFAEGPGLVLLEGKIRVISGATRLLSGDFGAMGQSIHNVILGNVEDARRLNEEMNRLHNVPPPPPPPPGTTRDPAAEAAAQVAAAQAAQAAQDAYTRSILEGGTQAEATAAKEAVLAAAMQASVPPAAALAQVIASSVGPMIAAAAGQQHVAQTAANTAAAQAALANVLVDETGKKLASAQAAEQLAQFQATLAQLGGAVAGGMFTAANGAQQLASQYHIAYVEALNLINAQAGLAHAQAAVTEGRAERDTAADRAQVGSDKALAANRALLAKLSATAKAAGGTKLSDQTKLNNQLIAGQETADGKLEDAERDHYGRLMAIQIDFAKKSLEQQKANEISKRQSQADFYDKLTSSDLNKKKGGSAALQQIDAQYQAAYQKSQELAQAGNAKLAADYLALKSKQAADELSYQEALAKAAEDKDKAEISRLEAIHKLRQDAAAEEEKQLLEGGDANVNAKDQATTDEAAKYADAQQQIITSSDRAADRQVANATRAGKAIDTTTLAIERQKQAYDTVGGPAAATGTSAPAGGSPATPAGALPTDAPILADLITSLMGKLDAVVAAEKDGAGQVVGAIRRIGSTGGVAA